MSNLTKVTAATFSAEVLESTLPVLVDFYTDWCPPCKRLAPILDELSKEFDGKIKFVKVNTDDDQDLAIKYNIESIPTISLIRNGQVISQEAGLPTKSVLQAALTEFAAS